MEESDWRRPIGFRHVVVLREKFPFTVGDLLATIDDTDRVVSVSLGTPFTTPVVINWAYKVWDKNKTIHDWDMVGTIQGSEVPTPIRLYVMTNDGQMIEALRVHILDERPDVGILVVWDWDGNV